MPLHELVDYLIIGHVCQDLTPNGPVIGGTAAYAGAAADVLGCRTAIVTSSASLEAWQAQLSGPTIYHRDAPETTTFANVYTAAGREQTLHARAAALTVEDVPPEWRRAAIVHLAPVAGEVDPGLAGLFSNSVIGLTPQGWMRQWDSKGRITRRAWASAKTLLPRAAVTVLSLEDLLDERMLQDYRRLARLLVVTRGEEGCQVYMGGEERHVRGRSVRAVDTTGAGDIFAAAFFVRLRQTNGNPWEAARFANEIAALSTMAEGLEAKMALLRAQLPAGQAQ